MSATMARKMSPAEAARVDEVEQRRRDGVVTEADMIDRWHILWPLSSPIPPAPAFPTARRRRRSIGTNVSIAPT